MNKVPRWVFRYVGNKTFDFSSKKKDFLPQNDQIWPKIGIFGQLCALLVGRLVVVALGLYLARHLFTLLIIIVWGKNSQVSADILLWPPRLSETSLPSCPLAVCVYNTSITSAMALTDFSKQLKPKISKIFDNSLCNKYFL